MESGTGCASDVDLVQFVFIHTQSKSVLLSLTVEIIQALVYIARFLNDYTPFVRNLSVLNAHDGVREAFRQWTRLRLGIRRIQRNGLGIA